jgi:hypothetical protein
MEKEAVLIVGAVVAVLAALGVAITPEDAELIGAVVVAALSILGAFLARSQVASKQSVEEKAGRDASRKIFRR